MGDELARRRRIEQERREAARLRDLDRQKRKQAADARERTRRANERNRKR